MLAIVDFHSRPEGTAQSMGRAMISRPNFLRLLATAGALSILPAAASGQEAGKIGFSAPPTGAFAENGKQMTAAIKIFTEQRGNTVAGRKVEVILRDDGGVPDQAKRIAQEFVVQSKVAVLAGYNPTPVALAAAAVATEAKIPQIVTGSSGSGEATRPAHIVRQLLTHAHVTAPIGEWGLKHGVHR